MTVEKVRGLLALKVASSGGAAAFARLNSLSPSYVGDVLYERREPGEKILKVLGLEKVITYRKAVP